MRKKDVLDHFGTMTKTAEFLGITHQAVSQWPDPIPEGVAYKLQVMTAGKLLVNPALYEKSSRGAA